MTYGTSMGALGYPYRADEQYRVSGPTGRIAAGGPLSSNIRGGFLGNAVRWQIRSI